MFEGLVENFLKSFLGEYIENLDPAKLSVSIWSGSIQLSDLRFRQDLCSKLGLPFDLRLGVIKKLNLEFPWTRLASMPVVCKLEQLFIVLTPQAESDWAMQDTTCAAYKQAKLIAMLKKSFEEAKVQLAQKMTEGLDKKSQK